MARARKTLAEVAPEVARDWHPTKNDDLTPDQVTSHSGKKVWWVGACGHEWDATVGSRTRGSGCPVCTPGSSRVLAGVNDLATLKPELAKQWHPTKNGDATPDQVKPGSPKKVWWLGKCGHEWQATIASRNKGTGCPYCTTTGRKRLLVGFNDLESCDAELSSQWHPVKNGETTPRDVTAKSHSKVWWQCHEDGRHAWEATVKDRAFGYGCPYCTNQKVLAGVNDLATLEPEIARQWHPTRNGDLTPADVTRSGKKRLWWLCEADDRHEWQATSGDRLKGYGCPYCSGNAVLAGYNDLATTHPKVAAEWHPTKNGKKKVTEVSKGSVTKYWWLCPKGHSYSQIPNSRTHGRGCPHCQKPWSVAEKEVYAYVLATFPELKAHENYRTQRLGLFELDIYVEDVRLGIEFNGEYWHDESRDPQIKDRHERKQAICDTHEVRLAVVWEKDWNERQDEVKEQISNVIAGSEIPAWMTYARE